MELAKPRIDFGLYTNDLDVMLRFWQDEVGLPFEELLPAGGGVRQHRHGLNGSVFKLNHSRDPLPDDPPCGYDELLIAREGLSERRSLTDPNGNRVTLVPRGEAGIDAIGIHLTVSDIDAFHDFYGRVLELEACGERAYRLGDSVIFFDFSPDAKRCGGMRAPGYRYFTVQVWDVDETHGQVTARGAESAHAPMTLGKVARISFIRDPDGNWIELSQRASLTGALDG